MSNNFRTKSNIFLFKGLCYTKNVTTRTHIRVNQGTSLQKRNFYNLWRKPSIEELKLKDNVPDNWKLIYKNKLDTYLLFIQIVTTTTATLLALALLVTESNNNEDRWTNVTPDVKHYDSDFFVFLTAFLVIVVVLQSLLSKMPIRIYNHPNKKEYKMFFYGNIPFSQKSCTYRAGQIFEYTEEKQFPWDNLAYLLKINEGDQRKLYLLEGYFRRPADLYIMMGLQSDPDADEKAEKKPNAADD